MAANLQQLLFTIGLIDRASAPAARMMNNITRVTGNIQRGMRDIGFGAAGLAGVGYTLSNILQPAQELNKALGDVRSLDVSQAGLNQLTDAALKFSMQYGTSAADFVRSSYDIQSSITGLSTAELAGFTNVSAILAKGTKANVADVTNYVGTMYGIFQQSADAMGKQQWIEQLAGQSATAVKLFKTTGTGMAEAFTAIGAAGQTAGVGMSEQMAVLGTLQATMSGSEAGTKYRSFLGNIGKAQDELGLKFVDAQGKMLPIISILEKIKGKYGAIDTVAKSDLLKKAFGTEEAVALVKLLSVNMGGLNDSINLLGQQTGMQTAIDMAKATVDPFDRLSESLKALKIVFGQTIITLLQPGLDDLNSRLATFYRWTQLFPNVTKVLAQVVFGLLALMATGAAFSLMLGVARVSVGGFRIALMALRFVMLPLSPLVSGLTLAWRVMMWQVSMGGGVLTAARFGLMAFTGYLWSGITAVWAWTAALLANPVTWMVVGVVALVAAVAAAVIYWDAWTGAVIQFAAAFMAWSGIGPIVDSVLAFLQRIPDWWNGFIAFMANLHPFDALLGLADAFISALLAKFAQIPAYLGSMLANINPFAGLGAALGGALASATGADRPAINTGPLNTAPKPNTPAGGIGAQISSVMYANRSNQVGAVNVHNYGQPMSGARLREELRLALP